MSEKALRYVSKAASWAELETVALNVKAAGQVTDIVRNAINEHSIRLGVAYILERTEYQYDKLSPAERKIVRAVGEYAHLLHSEGKHPTRTIQQIRRFGLLGAAEASVCKSQPTQGFNALADAELKELSYEQIVLDHPDEFSTRALRYARKTLGLPVLPEEEVESNQNDVRSRTMRLIEWLKTRAEANEGILRPFTNDESSAAIGLGSLRSFGKVHGNIQSRIDFACYVCDLPPLGCAAAAPFKKAWSQDDRQWEFPVSDMQRAAQTYTWTKADFQRLHEQLSILPGTAYIPWGEALGADEQKVRSWATQWSQITKEASKHDRHLARFPSEVLNRATPEYVWAAGQRFLKGEADHEFGESADFDIVIEGQRFAPKAVFGVALSMALGGQSVRPKHFTGGEGSACFSLLRQAGYSVIPKNQPIPASPVDVVDPEWSEGNLRLIRHWKRERASGLGQAKKSQHRRIHGKLTCDRCGLDPVSHFGSLLGEACIEVHHAKVQVSEMEDGHSTALEDLQCLCANCHRYVHKKFENVI